MLLFHLVYIIFLFLSIFYLYPLFPLFFQYPSLHFRFSAWLFSHYLSLSLSLLFFRFMSNPVLSISLFSLSITRPFLSLIFPIVFLPNFLFIQFPHFHFLSCSPHCLSFSFLHALILFLIYSLTPLFFLISLSLFLLLPYFKILS